MQKKLYVRYVALFALAICTASSAKAAEYTFQSAGGDLATPANWNATALGSGDIGVINQGGTYTLSDNLTLSQLKIATTSRCIFDFTDKNKTLKLSYANYPIGITAKADAHLKGGVWDFSGTEFRGLVGGCVFWLRNGAKITNGGHFYNCYNVKNWDVRLYEASKIECENYTLARNGQGVSLVVADGSAIEANATFASDRNSAGVISYNQIKINGANSKISSKDFVVGYTSSRNTLNVSDGGIVHASGRLTLGASSGTAISSTNTIRIADGVLTVEKEFFTGANSYDNVFTATNSVVNIATVSNLGARTVFDFQNCTVGIGNLRPFMRNGGRFRIGGSRTSLTISGDTANPFASDLSANNDNHLVFDDGVNITLTGNYRWMSASSNSTVSVSNGAKWTVDGNFYIGYNTANGVLNCKDNTIEISSRGEFEMKNEELRTYGTRNRIVVDNGTLRATSIRIGHSSNGMAPSPNCSLIIKGTTPMVRPSSGISFNNNGILRFEIPASGYSEGFSPIETPTFVPDSSTTLEVDYAAYLAAGGGTVTLVSFTNEPAAGFEQWLAAQNEAMNLPTGTKLRLVQNEKGYKVTFKAMKYPGMVISFK